MLPQKDIARIILLYEQHLLEREYVDFDIIVHTALRLIRDQTLVRQSLYAKFLWFAVDEYQDLGYPLFRIVTEMVNQTGVKLFAIGDPDQAIFDFAGTDPKYLIELSERSDMQPKIQLQVNYRSTKELISVCKAILGQERGYHSTEDNGRCRVFECPIGLEQQAQVIAQIIRNYKAQGVREDEVAVLHRWRKNGLNRIAQVLDSKDIDYVLDKHPLYDRTMGIIKWLEDLSYWCLSGWMVQTDEAADSGPTFDDLLATWLQFGHSQALGFGEDTNHARIYLACVLWNLRDPEQLLGDWLSIISRVLDLDVLFEQYRDTYPDEIDEFHHLRELILPGKDLSNLPLAKFANLSPSVQLTTLHSSKGTEFEVVIIAGVEHVESTANGRRFSM